MRRFARQLFGLILLGLLAIFCWLCYGPIGHPGRERRWRYRVGDRVRVHASSLKWATIRERRWDCESAMPIYRIEYDEMAKPRWVGEASIIRKSPWGVLRQTLL